MPEHSAEFALMATKEEPTLYLPRGVRTHFTWPCGGRVSRMVSVVEGSNSVNGSERTPVLQPGPDSSPTAGIAWQNGRRVIV